jgi:hypothetical protein
LALHVPESPFVHPPVAAEYVPASVPVAVVLPVKFTTCPFSLSMSVMVLFLTLPLKVAEAAQGG